MAGGPQLPDAVRASGTTALRMGGVGPGRAGASVTRQPSRVLTFPTNPTIEMGDKMGDRLPLDQ